MFFLFPASSFVHFPSEFEDVWHTIFDSGDLCATDYSELLTLNSSEIVARSSFCTALYNILTNVLYFLAEYRALSANGGAVFKWAERMPYI